MLMKYKMRFPENNSGYVSQSLVYFNDVIYENWPEMTNNKLTWDKVMHRLKLEIKIIFFRKEKKYKDSPLQFPTKKSPRTFRDFF